MALLKLSGSSSRRGLSTVEAALVIPLLLLLVMGIIEYGWMFLKVQQINNAARHGARIGITENATNTDVTAGVSALMADAGLAGSGYVLTLAPADVATARPGTALTVTVTVPYSNVSIVRDLRLIPKPANIAGSTTMFKEGVN
jgi:Flp pilus assembly protein TadG